METLREVGVGVLVIGLKVLAGICVALAVALVGILLQAVIGLPDWLIGLAMVVAFFVAGQWVWRRYTRGR